MKISDKMKEAIKRSRKFSVDEIVKLKKQYPQAKVLAHPECKGPVLAVADVVGSTAVLVDYSIKSAEYDLS